jgi:hypothetical protein
MNIYYSLFSVNGRSSHIAKLRAEFDTGMCPIFVAWIQD